MEGDNLTALGKVVMILMNLLLIGVLLFGLSQWSIDHLGAAQRWLVLGIVIVWIFQIMAFFHHRKGGIT